MIIFFIALTIAVFAAISLGLVGLATIEYKVVVQNGHATQLVQIVQSGIDAAAKAIDDLDHPDLFDNPERFCSIEVVPARLNSPDIGVGRFTVFSPRCEQDEVRGVRFGLTRESAKLSLDAVLTWEIESPGQGVQALQKLPGMTPTVIDSILDWLDADNDPRPQGAEAVYYKQQQKTYRPRNAVPVALEELLLVQGVERSMLFGEDLRRSFGATQSELRSPPSSNDADDPFAPLDFSTPFHETTSDSSAWYFLLTPYSAEKTVNTQGVVKVFLNESNLEFLESQLQLHQLDTESIQFIKAWRNTNGNIDNLIDLLDADLNPTVDSLPAPESTSDPGSFDVFGPRSSNGVTGTTAGASMSPDSETSGTTAGGGKSPFSCSEPAKYDRFLKLMDEAVADSAIVVRGRVNVNEAPRVVLEAVPELTSEMVTSILAKRKPGEETHRHAVWLLREGIVDKETMKTLMRRLTTGGDVYRVQVCGFFDDKPMFHRAEAVLDATVKPPRTVIYEDLTPLGLPE